MRVNHIAPSPQSGRGYVEWSGSVAESMVETEMRLTCNDHVDAASPGTQMEAKYLTATDQ